MIQSVLYCGLTTDKGKALDVDLVRRWFSQHVDAFTFTLGYGYWHGEHEPTAIVTVVGDGPLDSTLARGYADTFNQTSVLQVDTEAKGALIYATGIHGEVAA